MVELEARDRSGRAQVVSVDLYAGGDEPVTWPKPVTPRLLGRDRQAALRPRRHRRARPARARSRRRARSAVVEAPGGQPSTAGSTSRRRGDLHAARSRATSRPRIPVHFVLMRGRVPGTAPQPGNNTDLGKPATMAATAWLEVNPVANQVRGQLCSTPRARAPGQTIEVTINLKDPSGQAARPAR